MKELSFSNSKIGDNSNNNLVIQNSEFVNPVFVSASSNLYETLSNAKQFEIIQTMIRDQVESARRAHPLYPNYSTQYDYQLKRLISTPETEEALNKYPKVIKGEFLIEYNKYPYMDRRETPWEYAYRTQTPIELKTTAYQEYLGDIEDPFPITTFSEGMTTVISAPEFPPAVTALIVSGDVEIPISIRRKPCNEYDKTVIGSVSNDCGLDITITQNGNTNKNDFTINKVNGCDLSTQLLREKLFCEMSKTKCFKITVHEVTLLEAMFSDEELQCDIFKVAPFLVNYLECLIAIEKRISCKFDTTMHGVSVESYMAVFVLAASLENKWYKSKKSFDNTIRCDYDKIPDDLSEYAELSEDKIITGNESEIIIQGVRFLAKKYTIVYKGAIINNASSVNRRRNKKEKKILLTFRPSKGNEYFYTLSKFEGITVVH